jgi:hypothetical protein
MTTRSPAPRGVWAALVCLVLKGLTVAGTWFWLLASQSTGFSILGIVAAVALLLWIARTEGAFTLLIGYILAFVYGFQLMRNPGILTVRAIGTLDTLCSAARRRLQ